MSVFTKEPMAMPPTKKKHTGAVWSEIHTPVVLLLPCENAHLQARALDCHSRYQIYLEQTIKPTRL